MARTKKGQSIHLAGRVTDVEFVERKLALGLSPTDIIRQAISIWRMVESGEYLQNIQRHPATAGFKPAGSSKPMIPEATGPKRESAAKETKPEMQSTVSTNLDQAELDILLQTLDYNFFG
jgi:hypothetical protein